MTNAEPAGSSATPGVGEPGGVFRSTALEQSLGTYLTATVLARLVNFGRLTLLTWYMTRAQFGLLQVILLVANVLTPLCSFGLNEAIARYVPQYEHRGALTAFVRRSFIVLIAVTALTVSMILIFSPSLGELFYEHVLADEDVRARFSDDAPPLARLTGLVIGLLVVYFFLLAVLKGLRMFGALSRLELAHSFLFLASGIIVIITGQLSAFTLTALYAVSLAVPMIYYGPRLYTAISAWPAQNQNDVESQLTMKLLKFSIWTTLAGVTWQALLLYPVWFLNKIHGWEAVAVFSPVRQIGQFILVGAVAVSTVIMTMVTKTWESEGKEPARRQLSLAFRGTGLGLFILCMLLALARDGIILIFRSDYESGADILPLHLVFFLLGAYLAFLPGHFHLQEKTRHMFAPWATGLAANVLFAYWLVGPKIAVVRETALWQKLSPVLASVFVTGFSDPLGLDAAAWCGVFAIATAVALCVMLIRAECCKLDRGSYIILCAPFLLATQWWILLSGGLVLILVALRTELVFGAEERSRVIGYVFGSLRHVPPLRMLRRRNHDDD